jgi:hypothetical protein
LRSLSGVILDELLLLAVFLLAVFTSFGYVLLLARAEVIMFGTAIQPKTGFFLKIPRLT